MSRAPRCARSKVVAAQSSAKASSSGGGFGPHISLNHTCAMNHDNLKRLSRRTWCTTKRPDRLQCLVDLYACAHNDEIALKLKPRGELTPRPLLALEAAAQT